MNVYEGYRLCVRESNEGRWGILGGEREGIMAMITESNPILPMLLEREVINSSLHVVNAKGGRPMRCFVIYVGVSAMTLVVSSYASQPALSRVSQDLAARVLLTVS